MNWKYKIIFLTGGFIAMMLCMVIMAFRQNVDLVSEDYYEKEIAYGQQMNKLKNATGLNAAVSIREEEGSVIIHFPADGGEATGRITFFRPSDKSLDKTYSISANSSNEQKIDKSQLSRGHYKVSVDWKNGDKEYLIQKDLFIQ